MKHTAHQYQWHSPKADATQVNPSYQTQWPGS